MLTGDATSSGAADAVIEERVRGLIAEMAGFSSAAGSLQDASLDSLTLIAIVTRIEAAFAIEFDSDEVVALIKAHNPRAVAALVARKVAQANLNEPAGNRSC
jgi:acyl carrier protein